MAKTPTGRKNLKRAERREQLLQAALKAFGKAGYHDTHVEDICTQAGVARGTFYLHFKSKHEIFDALIERMLGIFLEVRPAEGEPEIKTLADAEAILRASYRVVLETFHQHRRLTRLLFDEAVGLGKGFRRKLEKHYKAWHERVAMTLDLFVDRKVARRGLDSEVTAQMVIGMVERITRRYLLTAAKPDIERLVDALVSFELAGIRR